MSELEAIHQGAGQLATMREVFDYMIREWNCAESCWSEHEHDSIRAVLESDAGKAAAEVIAAAREAYHVLMDMEASPDPWDVIGEAADILDCALLKFRNPADSHPQDRRRATQTRKRTQTTRKADACGRGIEGRSEMTEQDKRHNAELEIERLRQALLDANAYNGHAEACEMAAGLSAKRAAQALTERDAAVERASKMARAHEDHVEILTERVEKAEAERNEAQTTAAAMRAEWLGFTAMRCEMPDSCGNGALCNTCWAREKAKRVLASGDEKAAARVTAEAMIDEAHAAVVRRAIHWMRMLADPLGVETPQSGGCALCDVTTDCDECPTDYSESPYRRAVDEWLQLYRDHNWRAEALFLMAGERMVDHLVGLLSPSWLLRPRVELDGDQWCAMLGENLQSGVAGFGETPEEALELFDAGWELERARPGGRCDAVEARERGAKSYEKYSPEAKVR